MGLLLKSTSQRYRPASTAFTGARFRPVAPRFSENRARPWREGEGRWRGVEGLRSTLGEMSVSSLRGTARFAIYCTDEQLIYFVVLRVSAPVDDGPKVNAVE